MNLNLRCPEILQITKMISIINKNYQDSCTGCGVLISYRIMTIEKSNLILETRYGGISREDM